MTNSENEETIAQNIIRRLKMFNRKERDHLMKFALCENPKEPKISVALWKKISRGGRRPNPDAMFLGMDYHLNWLHAALATAKCDNLESEENRSKEFKNSWECESPKNMYEKNFSPIQKNQEDVDLLVAWIDRNSKRLQLVLIESKLDSGWSSSQIQSKKKRLTLIRKDAESRKLQFIDWRFFLLSPTKPSKAEFAAEKFEDFHDWNIEWVELKVDGLRRVKRVSDKSDKWAIV